MKYRLRSGFLTGIMKGKIRGAARDTLIGYKHFMETKEPNIDIKVLRKYIEGSRHGALSVVNLIFQISGSSCVEKVQDP